MTPKRRQKTKRFTKKLGKNVEGVLGEREVKGEGFFPIDMI